MIGSNQISCDINLNWVQISHINWRRLLPSLICFSRFDHHVLSVLSDLSKNGWHLWQVLWSMVLHPSIRTYCQFSLPSKTIEKYLVPWSSCLLALANALWFNDFLTSKWKMAFLSAQMIKKSSSKFWFCPSSFLYLSWKPQTAVVFVSALRANSIFSWNLLSSSRPSRFLWCGVRLFCFPSDSLWLADWCTTACKLQC